MPSELEGPSREPETKSDGVIILLAMPSRFSTRQTNRCLALYQGCVEVAPNPSLASGNDPDYSCVCKFVVELMKLGMQIAYRV